MLISISNSRVQEFPSLLTGKQIFANYKTTGPPRKTKKNQEPTPD
jgi:hypothetical protein